MRGLGNHNVVVDVIVDMGAGVMAEEAVTIRLM